MQEDQKTEARKELFRLTNNPEITAEKFQENLRRLVSLYSPAILNEHDPETGKTALHNAAENADVEKVGMLLRAGIDPDLKDAHGRTARKLLRDKQVARPRQKTGVGLSVFINPEEGLNIKAENEVLKMLTAPLKESSKPAVENVSHVKEDFKNKEERSLLKEKMDVSESDLSEEEAIALGKELRIAAQKPSEQGLTEVKSFLKKLKARKISNQLKIINARSSNGKTAFHWAGGSGNLSVMKCLLDAGVDSTLRDNKRKTAWELFQATSEANQKTGEISVAAMQNILESQKILIELIEEKNLVQPCGEKNKSLWDAYARLNYYYCVVMEKDGIALEKKGLLSMLELTNKGIACAESLFGGAPGKEDNIGREKNHRSNIFSVYLTRIIIERLLLEGGELKSVDIVRNLKHFVGTYSEKLCALSKSNGFPLINGFIATLDKLTRQQYCMAEKRQFSLVKKEDPLYVEIMALRGKLQKMIPVEFAVLINVPGCGVFAGSSSMDAGSENKNGRQP